MSIFDAPWNILVSAIIALLVFGVKEFVDAKKVPPTLPDRGVGFFHSGLLFLLMGALCVLGMYWIIRVGEVSERVMLYPNARYAPEREHLSESDSDAEWIFITLDTSSAVVEFYRELSRELGYRFYENTHVNTVRMLIARDKHEIFVTIVDEGDRRIIYYSEKGNARIVAAI